jgi:hypothetical protein
VTESPLNELRARTPCSVACLCRDEWCAEEIDLTLGEFESLEASAQFAIALGHRPAPGDRVVGRTTHYAVVEAREPSP